MTDILSTIADDILEYEQLCILYDEEIQLEQDLYGKWSPKCYSNHAQELKKRFDDEYKDAQRQIHEQPE